MSLPSQLDTQVGGSHYKGKGIQPLLFCQRNGLSFLEGNVIKYTTRHKTKNGSEDIKKALHYLQFILELEYGIRSKVTLEETNETA